MTRLILTRHGQTEWNVKGFVQGALDSPLSDAGIEQARRLSARLAGEKIDHIYSSPLGRAVSTARLIADPRHLQVCECPEFREISFGQWEGKSWKQLRSNEPELFAQWEACPYLFRFPQGEVMEDVLLRAKPRLHRLIEAHPGETICVVSHGITLKVLVTDLMGYSLADWLETPWQSNTALNIFEVEGNQVRALVLGDNSHVESSTA